MKPWVPLAFALLALLLAQGQRALSRPGEGPPRPRPPGPDDSLPELPDSSAIHATLIPGNRPGMLGSLSFSPDSKMVAAHNLEGVKAYDTRTGQLIISFDPGRGGPIFAPRGEVLAASIATGQWALFDPSTGRLLRAMDPHHGLTDRNGCKAVAFSSDGKLLAASYDTGEVMIWNVDSGKLVRTLPPFVIPAWSRGRLNVPARPAPVKSLAFSPDGVTLYAAGFVLRAWNVAATTEPRRFDLPADLPCGPMALSPDGMALAAAVGYDNEPLVNTRSIFLLDSASGRRRGEITTATTAISGLAFLPDGRKLVSLEGERDIRLWDVATARPVAACRFEKHFRLEDLAVSPDGRRIAASGQESDAIFGVIGMVVTDGVTLGPWRPTAP